MYLKEIAKMLDGREHRKELTKGEEQILKKAKIIAIFGGSDDLAELRGIIDDEVGAYNGATLYFDEEGKLLNNDYDNEELMKANCSNTIKVIADYKNYPVFRYETSIPHEKFNIMEDGLVYCEGICFYMKDLLE